MIDIEFDKRAMTEEEDKYTFRNSSQISSQCGLIGYLRADMDTDGNGFFSSWNNCRADLKTDEFKQEFDMVINALRENGEILHNRKSLANYCYTTPQSKMNGEDNYYGVRVDTERYIYMFRLNPNRGEYNVYCYCYVKDWISQHIRNSREGIRLEINGDVIHIPDNGKMVVEDASGNKNEYRVRYIDKYHFETDSPYNIYHSYEFSELAMKNGWKISKK